MVDVDAMIAALTAQPDRTALLVDFDGSLSPIVERAEDARPLPEVVALLGRLASRLGRVGIVSGRPVSFLAEHVPVPGVLLTGLYGMEHSIDGVRRIDPRVEPYLGAVAAAVDEVLASAPAELVEPKSGVSVTLHWRPDPDRSSELLTLATDVAARHGLATLQTRMAVEVRPPVAIDKGVAVRALLDGCAVAAFAGDDAGDLPAFAALRTAVDEGSLELAMCIGVNSPEAPAALVEVADVLVDGPQGLVALLARVADQLA